MRQQRNHQSFFSSGSELILENPQEDKDEVEGTRQDEDEGEFRCVPPWESTDLAIKRFFDDSQENKELDIIIRRECEQIEAQLKAIREISTNQGGSSNSKLKRAKKKNMQFSEHYNFMCEFQKRMKMRIDGSKEHYKFKKFKEEIQEIKLMKQQQIEARRQQRQELLKSKKLNKQRKI